MREWATQPERDASTGDGGLSTSEKDELAQLRRDNRRLREDVEMLKRATVIDLAARRVIGWATADHLRTDLVADALTDAVNRRRPAPGVVFHSDRGSTPRPSTPTRQGIWA